MKYNEGLSVLAKPESRRELRRVLLFFAAVLSLVFVARVYRDVERAALVWDDHVLVESEQPYRTQSIGKLLTESFWPESPLADARGVPYYRPAVLLSYRFDSALGGRAEDFHVTSLLLHLAACALLAIVAIRAGASYPGAIGAMLVWGVLPRLTEAVVWVSGRTDVLAAFFGLAALAVWPEMRHDGNSRSSRPWTRSILGAFLLFAALLAKEVAFAFVAVLVIASWRGDRKRAGVCIGGAVVVYAALRTIALAGRSAVHRPLGVATRVGTVLEACARYVEMTFDALHSRTSIGLVGEVDWTRGALGALVMLLALAAAVVVVRRGSFGARVGLALAALAIAPVLHVLPISIAGSVAADRLLYVPLAGVAIAAAGALRPKLAFLAPALALVLGVGTSIRVDDYLEETAFWTTAAETAHPHNTMPRLALAGWLSKAGEIEIACRLYERAANVPTTPAQHGRAREGLANCWARMGRYEDALRVVESVVADDPTNARAKLGLGFAELHLRAFDQASAAFDDATRRDPGLVPYRPSPLGWAKIKSDAELFTNPAVRLFDPDGWANHLAAIGRAPEAEAAFRALVDDDDADPDARQDAAKYLVVQGSLENAELALARVPPSGLGWDDGIIHLYRRRRRIHSARVLLGARIDALAN